MKKLILLLFMLPLALMASNTSFHTDYLYVDEEVTGIINETDLGSAIVGRAVTAMLYVSPNGDDTDGSCWSKAYTTIQGALAAASTDVNECTLILIGINTGANYYDINTTGDPTFTGNYILQGTHRTWQKVKNDHASATSILKFTGYTSLINLNFNLGTSNNGVQIAKGAFRVNRCQFVGEDLTSEKTALTVGDGSTAVKWGKITDCYFFGKDKTEMTALKLNKVKYTFIVDFEAVLCKVGLHIVHIDCDTNVLCGAGIDECATGIKIDAGNGQYFENVRFDADTTNVDDAVGDHNWNNIRGSFPITVTGALTGTQVDTHANAATYGTDTEIRSAASATKPFKIVGYHAEPSFDEKFKVRISADSGATFFDEFLVESAKNHASSAGTGTDFIFNKGTRISASAQSVSGGKNIKIWLEIQEI